MTRKYRNFSRYENEIIDMWNSGKSLREIGTLLGFTYDEVQDFKTSYSNKNKTDSA